MPDILAMDDDKRKGFIRNRTIVSRVIAGEKQEKIAEEFRINQSSISRIMTRCLGGDESEEPWLSQGLIPNLCLREVERKAPLSTLKKKMGGKGAFIALLEKLPEVKKQIDSAILKSVRKHAGAENITPKSLHSKLIILLQEAGWPSDTYPHTDSSFAYEALRRYYHREKNRLLTPCHRTERIIRSPRTIVPGVYDEIHIDEQTFDAVGRVDLVLSHQLIPLRLGRMSVAIAVDSASDCWLAYRLCLTEHPSSSDILALLHQIHYWQAPTLTVPGLQYLPGANLPAGLGGIYSRAAIGMIRMDNAYVHTATAIRDYVCCRLGSSINYGLPAQPKTRNIVEHAFDLLSDQAKRFSSTTGKNPMDADREPKRHRLKPPMTSISDLEQALHVVITAHNVKPQARLGGNFPLEVVKHHFESKFPRLLPEILVSQNSPFRQRQSAKVIRIKADNRVHINFHYLRYTGDCLLDNNLVGKEVLVDFDRRDIRVLKIYLNTGCYVGEVFAPATWSKFPHSIETRRYIHKLIKERRIREHDPLSEYFLDLVSRRDKTGDALEIVRVFREYGSPAGVIDNDSPNDRERNYSDRDSEREDSTASKIKKWSPYLAARKDQGQ